MGDGGHGTSNGAVIVAHLRTQEVLHGFVRTFAEACRDGVPVKVHLGSEYAATSGQSIDPRGASAGLLREQVERARIRAARARKLAVAAESEEEAAGYQAEARTWARKAVDAQHRLGLLDTAPDLEAPARFESDTSVLREALARLATAEDKYTREEYNAFRVVVPSFRLEPDQHGTWKGSAMVRLPIEGGVAEIGPVTWPIAAGGVGTPSLRVRALTPGGDTEPRDELRVRLGDVPGLTREAIVTVTNAPFRELPLLLLHLRAGTALPEWVGTEWQDPAFMAHVAAVYGNSQFNWMGKGQYARMSPIRQAIVDLTHEHGAVTLDQLRTVIPTATWRGVWANLDKSSGKIRPWAVPFRDLPAAGDRERRAAPVRCWCGEDGITVARVPEVPGDLLCAGGHAPLAPTSIATTVTFPPAYQALRIPREQWLAELARPMAKRLAGPHGAFRAAVLGLITGVTDGPALTTSELAEATTYSVCRVREVLCELEASGSVRRSQGFPMRWYPAGDLTDGRPTTPVDR